VYKPLGFLDLLFGEVSLNDLVGGGGGAVKIVDPI